MNQEKIRNYKFFLEIGSLKNYSWKITNKLHSSVDAAAEQIMWTKREGQGALPY